VGSQIKRVVEADQATSGGFNFGPDVMGRWIGYTAAHVNVPVHVKAVGGGCRYGTHSGLGVVFAPVTFTGCAGGSI